MAEEQNNSQEKTHEASEQKLKKARQKGDIIVSTELHTFMFYIGSILSIIIFAGLVASSVAEILTFMLERPEQLKDYILQARQNLLNGPVFGQILIKLYPLFLLPALFVLISLIAQRGIVFAPDKIKPKLSKLSIIQNAKKKYGAGGIGEFIKSFAKLLLISIIAAFVLQREFVLMPAYSGLDAVNLPLLLKEKGLELIFYIMLGAGLIAVIDWPAKWFAHKKKMKMTLQETKDERKESEGDPHAKQIRRQRAREIAQTTMLQDVVGANVVIVNPEHYAIALKWDRQGESAPICVAKGVDEMAFRIRKRAKLAGVAIYENPPVARALYAKTNIGEMIAAEHYAAVAAAIHYADQLGKRGF